MIYPILPRPGRRERVVFEPSPPGHAERYHAAISCNTLAARSIASRGGSSLVHCMIPRGLLANPALSVAALAERNIERIAAEDLHI